MNRKINLIVTFVAGSILVLTCISFNKKETQTDRLLKISNEYKSYSRYDNLNMVVTDSAMWIWTLSLCVSSNSLSDTIHSNMISIVTDSFHISSANISSSLHGNKLYKLFVKDMIAYDDTTLKFQPLGQVLVKETWNVRTVSKDSISKLNTPVKQSLNDGKWYSPTTVSELFIMYKEPISEYNDEGWVYGIVNLEKNKEKPIILESGKISSCIGCHIGTKYDRIFGLK